MTRKKRTPSKPKPTKKTKIVKRLSYVQEGEETKKLHVRKMRREEIKGE